MLTIWNRIRKKHVLILAAVIVSLSLLKLITGSGTRSSSGRLGTVEKGDLIQRVTVAGNIVPIRKGILAATYRGYVKKIFVTLGQKVKQGDPVVTVVQSLQSSESAYPMRAPFDGVVVQIQKSEGEFVREGDPKDYIVRIDDMTQLFVLATVPEVDITKLKSAQAATIQATGVVGRSYHGKISDVSLASQEKDGWEKSQIQYLVKVMISDADEHLKPGMSALVDVIADRKEGVLMLKHEFIQMKGKSHFVTLKNGTRRDVTVGMQNDEAYEITEGLKLGDEVRQVNFYELSQ